MKKEYQKPEYEIILLNGENVIRASGSHWDLPDSPMNAPPRQRSVWSDD